MLAWLLANRRINILHIRNMHIIFPVSHTHLVSTHHVYCYLFVSVFVFFNLINCNITTEWLLYSGWVNNLFMWITFRVKYLYCLEKFLFTMTTNVVSDGEIWSLIVYRLWVCKSLQLSLEGIIHFSTMKIVTSCVYFVTDRESWFYEFIFFNFLNLLNFKNILKFIWILLNFKRPHTEFSIDLSYGTSK